jgi:hypothetical protein
MTSRGQDHSQRKKRGGPSVETLQTRASKKSVKEKAASKSGYNALFAQPQVAAVVQTPAPIDTSASSALKEPVEIPFVERRDALQPDVYAEFDDDAQLDDEDTRRVGVMQAYNRAVQNRLREEVNNEKPQLLLAILKDNGWWLRVVHSRKVCIILELDYSESSYYRDVYVWLPDVRWGPAVMPSCPSCTSNAHVGFHAWRDNHAGRRICNLNQHYFTISRRYKCNTCHESAKQARTIAMGIASAAGIMVSVDEDAPDERGEEADEDAEDIAAPAASTFMAWNKYSLAHLPFGYGSEFPAFLTHRSGIDFMCIDLMRSLGDKGVRKRLRRSIKYICCLPPQILLLHHVNN